MNTESAALLSSSRAWCVPEYLEELQDVDSGLVCEMLHLFLEDSAAQLEKLSEQISRADLKGTSMTLHGLKGSFRQIGAMRGGDLLEGLESDLQAGGMASVSEHVGALRAEFERVRSEMLRALAPAACQEPAW